jgi:BCD family chlorophyll transporter-like MFS transporter
MNRVSENVMKAWAEMGPRFLPFADAASPDMPLSRLLRLSLFQVSVGMALVLLVGTLNRVMIVELGVPASLVGIMISLPLVFAPFRALIGFHSDNHRSHLGWRRTPFIFRGTMVQFGGLCIMPFALLVLSGGGDAARVPAWVGCAAAGLSFLLVGAGLHTTQTVGLALATDLTPEQKQPQVVGLMYVSLLAGMIASALIYGMCLVNFTPARLIQVIQGAAAVTILLNGIALWKQEGRERGMMTRAVTQRPSFTESWGHFLAAGQAVRRLAVIGLGTAAFSMEDVLLEPYGGQILHLPVSSTTRLTATLALGGLIGFALASRILSRGADPFRMACFGAACGIPAFAAVIFAAPAHSLALFAFGTFGIGFGAGLFGHGTLTATMRLAPDKQAGLALGAWGAVQASAAGIAIACGGIIRDSVAHFDPNGALGAATGYDTVYVIEVALLLITFLNMLPLIRRTPYAAGGAKLAFNQKGSLMPISRLYQTAADTSSAIADLKAAGYQDSSISTVTTADGYISPTTLTNRGVQKPNADEFAPQIRAGASLLLVAAPLGYAADVTEILEKPRAGDTGTPVATYEAPLYDEAAPLSSALGLSIISDNPTPFETVTGIPTVMKKYWFFSNLFGMPLLSKKPAPLSTALGLKLLTENPAPFSSLLKLPLLAKG